jgi:hypothetical protein
METKFLKGLEEHGGTCGTPADELKLVKERHAWALWIGSLCGKTGTFGRQARTFGSDDRVNVVGSASRLQGQASQIGFCS